MSCSGSISVNKFFFLDFFNFYRVFQKFPFFCVTLYLCSSMTAVLEGGEWSAARPGRTLPPGKTQYPLYRRLAGPQGRSGRAEHLASPGFDPRIVQPVVSRYSDWAIRLNFLPYTAPNVLLNSTSISLFWRNSVGNMGILFYPAIVTSHFPSAHLIFNASSQPKENISKTLFKYGE